MPVDSQPDAAVLGHATLGDVELGHDLHAGDDAGGHPPRHRGDVAKHPIDAQAHAQILAIGGQVQVGGALFDGLADELVNEPHDGRVVGGLVQLDDRRLLRAKAAVVAFVNDVANARETGDHVRDVLAGRDDDANLVAGQDRDVVDRVHVRRIRHRDHQRAVPGGGDRQRVVALGDLARDEVRGRHVHVEDTEVDVVEPVALGQRHGHALRADCPAREQHTVGRGAAGSGDFDRLEHPLA